MGRTKRDSIAQDRPAEYAPIRWIQTSGFSVHDDALYCCRLSTKDYRRHEIERLMFHHGRQWATAVEQRVREFFAERANFKQSMQHGPPLF